MSGVAPTLPEDCQSQAYDWDSDAIIACAKKIDPSIYGEYNDLPIEIERDVLPTGLKTLLTDCDGNSNCKLVAYDFEADTGQKASSAEYITTVANTDMLDRGVFIKDGSTPPVITVEPPGYTYSTIPINSLQSQVVTITPAVPPTAADQKSSETCARFCDTLPTCVAFNYNSLASTCKFFSSFDSSNSYSYGEASFNDTTYIKDPVTSAVGKKQAGLMYTKTWLENTGGACTAMDLCNSNLTALVNTGTTVGFSTDDLLACSYCPTRTFQFKDNAYFVQDEVGQTKTFQDRSTAIAELLFTDVPNPNNTIRRVGGVNRGTQDFMLYSTNSYDTQLGFSENLLFVSSGELEEEYSIYKVLIETPDYTCYPDIDASTTKTYTFNGVPTLFLERTYHDSIKYSRTTNPGWLRGQGCPVTTVWRVPVSGDDGWYEQEPVPPPVGLSQYDGFRTLCGNKCYATASSEILCTYRCPSGYTGASFSEGVTQDCGNQRAKICSKPAVRLSSTSPAVFKALTNRLLPAPIGASSSNTFMIEEVDYVTDGFMFRNVQTQKYVTGRRELLDTWSDKYSSDYNKSIFVLSNPINILDSLKASFPNASFLLQSPDGTRYTYDRTTVRTLQNVFSLFPLTFKADCTPPSVSDPLGGFNTRTMCTPSNSAVIPSGTATTYEYSMPTQCPNETNWLVIDIPNGFDLANSVPDTTNVADVPSNFLSAYNVLGIVNTLMFPSSSYINYSVTSDNKNLRQWIQDKIYYPYVYTGKSAAIATIKTYAYRASYYYQNMDCFNTKFGEINTSMQISSMVRGTTQQNSMSNNRSTLESVYTASLYNRNQFLTTVTLWDDLALIDAAYNSSVTSLTTLLKTFLGFIVNQAFTNFRTVMNVVLAETGKYMVEAYGINDDDLQAISNSGSGKIVAGAGTVGLITLYQEIRNRKNDVDLLLQSTDTDIIAVQEFLAGTPSQLPNGGAPEILTPETLILYGYDVSMISKVDTSYTKYKEAYDRLQLIKRSASPQDVPRIEDAVVQAALNSIQKNLNETMIDLKVMELDPITNQQLQDQIQSAMKNAAETAMHTSIQMADGKEITTEQLQDQVQSAMKNAAETAMHTSIQIADGKEITIDEIQGQVQLAMKSAAETILYTTSRLCGFGYSDYSATGIEPCLPCTVCAAAPANAKLTESGCSIGTDNRTCTYACNEGFTTSGSGSTILCTCPNGVISGGVCNTTACVPGSTYSQSGYAPCTPCKQVSACSPNALTGGSVTVGGCTPTGTNPGTCTYTCNEGFTTSGSGSATSCTCPGGKYINGSNQCVFCTQLSSCPANTTSTAYSIIGCSGTTGPGTCGAACNPGYTDVSGMCCIVCPANTTSTAYTRSGCTSSTLPGTCGFTCNTGYTNVNGTCSAVACEDGKTFSSTGKEPCTTCSSRSCTGDKWYTVCTVKADSGFCQARTTCTDGTSFQTNTPGPTEDRTCKLCQVCKTPDNATDASTGCSGTDDRTCGFSCKAGYYKNAAGTGCTACDAGTYSLAGATSCSACPVGTYNPNTGQSSCYSCGTGSYQDKTGQTSCIRCIAGTYQPNRGASSCSPCRSCSNMANSTSTAYGCAYTSQTSDDRTCTYDCNNGYYKRVLGSGEDAFQCKLWTDCVSGEYASNTPNSTTNRFCSTCRTCGNNQYQTRDCANGNGPDRSCGTCTDCSGIRTYGVRTRLMETVTACTATSDTKCQVCTSIFQCDGNREFYIYHAWSNEFISGGGTSGQADVDTKRIESYDSEPNRWIFLYGKDLYNISRSFDVNNYSSRIDIPQARNNSGSARVYWGPAGSTSDYLKWTIAHSTYNPYANMRGARVTISNFKDTRFHLNNCKNGGNYDLQVYPFSSADCDTFSLIFADTLGSWSNWTQLCDSTENSSCLVGKIWR